MSFISLITVICAVLTLLVGSQVYLSKSTDRKNQAFLLLTAIVGWMHICWYEMGHTSDLTTAAFYRKLQAGWVLINPILLFCLWHLARFDKKVFYPWIPASITAFAILPAVIFIYLELFTPFGHGQVVRMPDGSWGLEIGALSLSGLARAIWTFLISALCIFLSYAVFREERNPRLKRMKGILFVVLSFYFSAAFFQNYCLPVYGVILPVNEALISFISILIFGWAFTNFEPIHIGSGATMDNILESMTNLLVVTDTEFRIKNVNPTSVSFFGKSPQEMHDTSICVLLGKSPIRECAMAMRHKPGRISKELQLQSASGEAYVHFTISPVYDHVGEPVGYTFIGTDLTDFVKAEDQIRQYADKLKNSNEALEHFAYIASHDLKEPLRMVNGFVTLLERKMGRNWDTQTTEYFTYITEGVKRMYAIIESILDISRLEYKDGNLEQVETLALIDQIKEKLSQEEKPITIRCGTLPAVFANPDNLEIVFHNIIENGIKYNNKTKAVIQIDCRSTATFNEFSIRDNGIGIEPAFHEHIFKMFKRLHTRVQYEGTGMGLAISKRIIEGLGGQIWVESVPGQGTTFKFSLPKIHENVKAVTKTSPFPLTQAS